MTDHYSYTVFDLFGQGAVTELPGCRMSYEVVCSKHTINTGVKDGDPECCSSVTLVQKAHTSQTKSSDGGDYHYTSSGLNADLCHLLTLRWQQVKQYFKFHSPCL